MKSNTTKVVASLLLFQFTIFSSTVMADSPPALIDQQIQHISVTINGVNQNFPQSAVLKNGAALVPMRAIFEKFGASLLWNPKTSSVTATKGDTVIKLTIGNQTAYVNGAPVRLSSKPQLVNGNTMVPLRFVSEVLGGSVTWDQANKTVKS